MFGFVVFSYRSGNFTAAAFTNEFCLGLLLSVSFLSDAFMASFYFTFANAIKYLPFFAICQNMLNSCGVISSEAV